MQTIATVRRLVGDAHVRGLHTVELHTETVVILLAHLDELHEGCSLALRRIASDIETASRTVAEGDYLRTALERMEKRQ